MKHAIAAALAAVALGVSSSTAGAAIATSSNWAGYAVSGTTYKRVSGTWVQPTANCATATTGTTASAFWIGLGGNSTTSNALEQTGTEADCLPNGTVRYSAWYELVPKASVKIGLNVSAGDRIAATVTVNGTAVVVQLTNLNTKTTFAKTLRMASPEISSAEWVAEAPSALTPRGAQILPLTNFGAVSFADATATSSSGHTGTIADSTWSATRIQLISRSGGPGGPGGPFGANVSETIGGTTATPSILSSAGDAFTITFHENTSSATQTYGV